MEELQETTMNATATTEETAVTAVNEPTDVCECNDTGLSIGDKTIIGLAAVGIGAIGFGIYKGAKAISGKIKNRKKKADVVENDEDAEYVESEEAVNEDSDADSKQPEDNSKTK
jgi:hypothetical protein